MGPLLIRRQVGVVSEHARTVESARADLRLADRSREPGHLHPPRSRLIPPSLSRRGPEGPQAALADDRHAKSDDVGWNARTGDSVDSRDARVGRLRLRASRRHSVTRAATPSRQQKPAEEHVSDTLHAHILPALTGSPSAAGSENRLTRLPIVVRRRRCGPGPLGYQPCLEERPVIIARLDLDQVDELLVDRMHVPRVRLPASRQEVADRDVGRYDPPREPERDRRRGQPVATAHGLGRACRSPTPLSFARQVTARS